jgi:hypothetical protein
VDAGHRDEFIRTLEGRLSDLNAAQTARIKRVIKQASALA